MDETTVEFAITDYLCAWLVDGRQVGHQSPPPPYWPTVAIAAETDGAAIVLGDVAGGAEQGKGHGRGQGKGQAGAGGEVRRRVEYFFCCFVIYCYFVVIFLTTATGSCEFCVCVIEGRGAAVVAGCICPSCYVVRTQLVGFKASTFNVDIDL